MPQNTIYDCIIIGAGPGGLQAAIHLARYNRKVLLFDVGGGRTRHAMHIENYLGLKQTTGMHVIKTGLEQVLSFGVEIKREKVLKLSKEEHFVARTESGDYAAHYVVASSGVNEVLPQATGFNRFFGRSIHTCVDCDGYLTTGKNLLVLGNSVSAVRVCLGMQQMYTRDITLLMTSGTLPPDYAEALEDESIPVIYSNIKEFLGEEKLNGVRLASDETLPCGAVMVNLGVTLNDAYLEELALTREQSENDNKIITNNIYETSIPGLFAVGALRAGKSQAIIVAGHGASVAIEINQRMLAI